MELKDRLDVLIQAVQIAQTKGVLSLDDAVVAKNAIDLVNSGRNLDIAIKILIKIATLGQSKGCYSLRDAYMIYVVSHDIFDILPIEKESGDEQQLPEPEDNKENVEESNTDTVKE